MLFWYKSITEVHSAYVLSPTLESQAPILQSSYGDVNISFSMEYTYIKIQLAPVLQEI